MFYEILSALFDDLTSFVISITFMYCSSAQNIHFTYFTNCILFVHVTTPLLEIHT